MSWGYQTGELFIGPYDFYFNGQIMGHTEAGIKVAISQPWVEVSTDLYRGAPIEAFNSTARITMAVRLLQVENDKLLKLLIGSSESAGPTTKQVDIGAEAGSVKATDIAAELKAHLRKNSASDESEDWVVHKAVCISDLDFDLTSAAPGGFDVVFGGLVDTSKASDELMGRFREDAT